MYDYFHATNQVLYDNVGKPEIWFSENELLQLVDACDKCGLKDSQVKRKVQSLSAYAAAKVRFSGKQTRIRAD